jgi:hypothetical protein
LRVLCLYSFSPKLLEAVQLFCYIEPLDFEMQGNREKLYGTNSINNDKKG